MKSTKKISSIGTVEINSPGKIIKEDNVVMVGLYIELLRVEPEEKYCVVRRSGLVLSADLPMMWMSPRGDTR